jgi:hypothetical protein
VTVSSYRLPASKRVTSRPPRRAGTARSTFQLAAFIQQRIPAAAIDGSGPPRSRAAQRRAATNRSSQSMVSMLRTAAILNDFLSDLCRPAR